MPVREVWRYPVKSLGGERVPSARALMRGLEGDREHGLLFPARPGEPGRRMTARERPALLAFRARWTADEPPLVTAPDGSVHRWGDAGLDEVLRRTVGPYRPYTVPAGAYDAWPVHLLGSGSIAALAARLGRSIDARRFRCNLLCDLREAFVEDEWVGRVIVVGDAILRVVERCERSTVTSLDPDTGAVDAELLDLIVREHEACLGVYCEVVAPGRISEGAGVNAG